MCNYNYSYNYSHFGIVQLQLRGFIFFPISIAIAVIAITFQLPSQLHTVLWISISVLDLIKTIKESNTFHGWFLVKLIHFEMEHSEGKISCIKYMCSITTAITITHTFGLINYNNTHLWFVQSQYVACDLYSLHKSVIVASNTCEIWTPLWLSGAG